MRWPRVFAGEDGLPAGLQSQVAPLLRFLDRNSIRYDLTSDLDLALSDAPRASDRKGVLLAGSERWVTRPLARRLRRYVQDGGRVATFGPETLRRGVTLRANGPETGGRAAAPHAAEPGRTRSARTLEPLRRAKDAERRSPSSAATRPTGCSTGSDGTLDGFSAFEESAAAGARTAARRCSPRSASRRRSPTRTRPPTRRVPEARYALTADRLGEKGARDPRRPAGVGAAAAGAARSRRSRATSSTCCAARSRRSATTR